jgi:hypothetical protein
MGKTEVADQNIECPLKQISGALLYCSEDETHVKY